MMCAKGLESLVFIFCDSLFSSLFVYLLRQTSKLIGPICGHMNCHLYGNSYDHGLSTEPTWRANLNKKIRQHFRMIKITTFRALQNSIFLKQKYRNSKNELSYDSCYDWMYQMWDQVMLEPICVKYLHTHQRYCINCSRSKVNSNLFIHKRLFTQGPLVIENVLKSSK